MNAIKSYRDILVWQKGMILVNKVYGISKNFPDTEKYVLTNQMKRSVISIPSIIAESYSYNTLDEVERFSKMALGSLYELQTQLEIALNQRYLRKEMFDNIYEDCREIESMLKALVQSIAQYA